MILKKYKTKSVDNLNDYELLSPDSQNQNWVKYIQKLKEKLYSSRDI